MSYAQFGYSSYTTSSPLVLGSSSGQTPCYERTGVSPEATQYDTRLYPRLPTYASTYQPESASLDPTTATTFYAPGLNSTYGMKESPDPWRSISQSASYYYDPTLAAYGYGGLDFNGARRKNVTRDSTSTLKAWLNEHRKNPYPTKGEKIMLAIITKMTLTQVSTWFANARRRLKKENKMTWEPRNKAESTPGEDSGGECGAATKREPDTGEETQPASEEEERGGFHAQRRGQEEGGCTTADRTAADPQTEMDLGGHRSYRTSLVDHPIHHQQQHQYDDPPANDLLTNGYTPSSQSSSPDLESYLQQHRPLSKDLQQHCYQQQESFKPKIWSLADTATNKALQPPYDLGWMAGSTTTPQVKGGSFQSSCSAVRFGGYFNPASLQTDTPPQTPPNMKVVSSQQQAPATATVPSSAYLESHAAYLGQPQLCHQEAIDVQMQDDKLDTYPSSHGSVMPHSSSSNPSSDCISEDYDDPSQYSAPSIR